MDTDRKSTVSSFYGGRKSSLDALNADFIHPAPERGRDDASSFYNPERTSMDHLNGVGRASAGYNRGSFFHAGREEPLKGGRDEEEELSHDGAWDVYADFNNAGPRYSSAFGTQNPEGYQQLPPPTPTSKSILTDPTNPVEMVTVPALGPEWAKSEMRGMTKAAKREDRADSRKLFWKSWNRGERGLCGKYFTKKVLVFFLFGLCACIGLVLAFTIPRVPSFAFNAATPLANATGAWATAVPTIFSRFPANFSFPAFASLELNTNDNYLPVNFKHLRASVFDLETNRLVGTGDLGHRTVPAKAFPDIMLPLNFTYITTNDTDQTWLNWYNGCKNQIIDPNGVRPAVKFRLVLDMDIVGLPSTRTVSAQVSNAECPIELPINSV